MIFKGSKAVRRIYKGTKHVLRVYKGVQLWYKYAIEKVLIGFGRIITYITAKLSAIDSDGVKATGNLEIRDNAVLSNKQRYINGTETAVHDSTAKIELDYWVNSQAESLITGRSESDVSIGHASKLQGDNGIALGFDEPTIKAQRGLSNPEEQRLHVSDIAQLESGNARAQRSENHIVFKQKTPTGKAQKGLPKSVTQKIYVTDIATAGIGKAKSHNAITGLFFSTENPTMLAQKKMPKPTTVKLFTGIIGKIGKSKVKAQTATGDFVVDVRSVAIDRGTSLPKPKTSEVHISDVVTGGIGHSKPIDSVTNQYFTDSARVIKETQNVIAEITARSDNTALFEKTYGKPINAENGGISGDNAVIYTPEKLFKTDNSAGGVSGAETNLYKKSSGLITDTIIKSGAFARLFRVVELSAVTTAKLISAPPLFRVVEMSATGGGVSRGLGLLGKGTYEELFGWAVQYDNVLYIFQANTITQNANVLSVDTNVIAWHNLEDNVLYINKTSTTDQDEKVLYIDTLEQLPIDNWAVQTDNVLLINGILDNEIEVI